MGNPVQSTTGWSLSESTQPDSLISEQKKFQSNLAPAGWWVKRVGSRAHLIKKNTIFFCLSQN